MNKVEIAQKAAELIGGGRAQTHGPALENHARIAAVWNGILRAKHNGDAFPELDAHDVANLMEGLKIARRYLGTFNVDDYVDGCGYAACAGEIRAEMDKKQPERGNIIEVPQEECTRCANLGWINDTIICCKDRP